MDNSDISFQCLDADEAIEENANEESDQVTVTVRINSNGKNVRGRDIDWKEKVTYASAKEYHDSPLFTDIKDQYTLKRKHDLEYGESQHFTCKFARRKKYVKCTHEYKIIFPAELMIRVSLSKRQALTCMNWMKNMSAPLWDSVGQYLLLKL